MCELLGVDLVHTSPYRPQTNGAVERFHGTLKPILAKAGVKGIDWLMFLHMALFAVRQTTNKDTGYSTHEVVFGKCMRGPLNILYAGWAEEVYSSINISKWVITLQDRLLALHKSAHILGEKSTNKRADAFNKNWSLQELKVMIRFFSKSRICMVRWKSPGKGPTEYLRSCLELTIGSWT